MANKIKIKRRLSTSGLGAGTPVGLEAGELFVNFVDQRLYAQGDLTNPLEFADKNYVDTAITSATGSLGTMSTQNADSVAITGGNIDGTAIGATTASSGAFTTLTASSAPSASNDVVRKTDLDSAITALGSVFRFIGDISAATNNDLLTLSDQTTGAYYRVDVAGTYVAFSDSFDLKVGDAIVKTASGWQKIDNVDVEVLGTVNEIAVTGDENAGYTVAIDPAFSGRLSTAETDIADLETKTQNISSTETVAGTTKLTGSVNVDSSDYNYAVAGTQVTIGSGEVQVYKSSEDVAVKLSTDGIYRDWASVTPATDLKLETNSGSVLVKAQNGQIKLDGSVTNVSNYITVAGFDPSMAASGFGAGQDPNTGGSFIRLEGSADTIFEAGGNGIILGSQFYGAAPSSLNVQCRLNLLGVDDPNGTKMNIDNFVIDGGEF